MKGKFFRTPDSWFCTFQSCLDKCYHLQHWWHSRIWKDPPIIKHSRKNKPHLTIITFKFSFFSFTYVNILLNSSNFKDSNAPNFESSFLKKGTSLQKLLIFCFFWCIGWLVGVSSVVILQWGVPKIPKILFFLTLRKGSYA